MNLIKIVRYSGNKRSNLALSPGCLVICQEAPQRLSGPDQVATVCMSKSLFVDLQGDDLFAQRISEISGVRLLHLRPGGSR